MAVFCHFDDLGVVVAVNEGMSGMRKSAAIYSPHSPTYGKYGQVIQTLLEFGYPVS